MLAKQRELRTSEVAEPPMAEPLEAPRAGGGQPTFRLDLAGVGSSPRGGHLESAFWPPIVLVIMTSTICGI
jgi:hypothetical protein